MSNMHFPDKYFVVKRLGSENPLAFLVPDGTDSAARKRKDSALSWAYLPSDKRQAVLKGDPDPAVYVMDNVLKGGFKIARNVRRAGYFGSGNVVWRVVHPDGFEFEISSENLESIIEETDIIGGVIQAKCIIARNGARNALIPESCADFQKTLVATQVAKEKTYTIRQAGIVPGDTVRLKSNLVYGHEFLTYIGEFFPVALHTEFKPNLPDNDRLRNGNLTKNSFVNHAKRHIFAYQRASNTGTVILSDPKIIDFSKDVVGLDPAIIVNQINATLQKKVGFVTDSGRDVSFNGDWISSAQLNALSQKGIEVTFVGIMPTNQTVEWETKIIPRMISCGDQINVVQWQTNPIGYNREYLENYVGRGFHSFSKQDVLSKIHINVSHVTYFVETDLARNNAKIFCRKQGSDWFHINPPKKVRVGDKMVENYLMFPDDSNKPNRLPILRMVRVEPGYVGVDEIDVSKRDIIMNFYDTKKSTRAYPHALVYAGDKLTFCAEGYKDCGGIFSGHSEYRPWIPDNEDTIRSFYSALWKHSTVTLKVQPNQALADINFSNVECSSEYSFNGQTTKSMIISTALLECAENTFDLIENFAQYEFAQFALSIEPKN